MVPKYTSINSLNNLKIRNVPYGYINNNKTFQKYVIAKPKPMDDDRPLISYAGLIRIAIRSSSRRKMTLKEIYNFIIETFPFFDGAKIGWKHSIRQNLSLHKCFLKVARDDDDPGIGSYWAIKPLKNTVKICKCVIQCRKYYRNIRFLNVPNIKSKDDTSYNKNGEDIFINERKEDIKNNEDITKPPMQSPQCLVYKMDIDENNLLLPILDTGLDSIVSIDESTARLRCVNFKHQGYTDEYGNYIAAYSEECDEECYSLNNL